MIVINDDFKKGIGKRLQELRRKNKLSRNKLLEKLSTEYHLDIDEKTLRRYENGSFIPKIDNLVILCEVFGVSLDYIVFGKQTSDDNSFTWKDSLKRLNRLIFTCVLIPKKEEDVNSQYYGKHYFAAYDDETNIYLERMSAFMKSINYGFEVRNESPMFDISDLDKLIGNFETYSESLYPSVDRLDSILISAKTDPELYMDDRLEHIKRKRKGHT